MTLRSDTLPSTKRAGFVDDTVFGTIRGFITIVTRFGIFVKRWCQKYLEYAGFRHHRIKILSFYVTMVPIS